MSRGLRLLVVFGLGAGLLVACGDDDDATSEEATEEATEAPTEEATEAPTEAPTEEPTVDEAAEAAAVEENVTAFFDGLAAVSTTPAAELDALVDATIALLQDGGPEEAEQLKGLGTLAAGLTVDIKSVTIIDETNAEYVFDLLIDGNPTQVTDATGKAIKSADGVWQVSQETWVALAALADTGGDDEAGSEEDEAAAVEENVTAFFDGLAAVSTTPAAELDALVDATIALLQDGGPEEAEQLKGLGTLAAGLTVDIKSVTIIDETNAEYVFDLLIDGNPTQVTDATGKAIKSADGVWQVSQETWVALAALADTGEDG